MLAILLLALPLQAAQVSQISPRATGDQIEEIRGPHLAIAPDRDSPDSPLLISLGGTNSNPLELLDFGMNAAALGYHVIGVDYPNSVITTVCRKGGDDECFDDFRKEIVWGVDESALVSVNADNCVLARIQRLLTYLSARDQRWTRYVRDGQVDWKTVVVAGHSQGSGHAAFLAKNYSVARAILFAGPQDVAPWGQAEWLGSVSMTPAERFFGFIHLNDSFGSELQIRALQRLMERSPSEVLRIKDDVPGASAARILISDLPEQNAHMAPITPRYKKVWDYLLRRETAVSNL